MQPSPAQVNIPDPAALIGRVQEVMKALRGIKRISLGLPDPSVRATVLSVDTGSVRGRDLEPLIRWQMEKKFLSSLTDTRVGHQTVAGRGGGVLGVAIRAPILQGYEEVIRQAGAEPVRVGVSSFQLYNLYHDLMQERAGRAGRFIAMNIFEGNFTMMIFTQGIMEFVRIKGLRPPSGASISSGDVQRSLSELILEEMNQSLKFYGQYMDPTDITHLFVFGRSVAEFIKKAHDRYHLEVEPLEPERLGNLQGMEKIRPEEIPMLTPAIAAALDGVGR